MRYSIRFKITIITIIAVLAGTLSVFAVSYSTIRSENDRIAVDTLNLIRDDAHHSLEQFFQSIEQSVEMAANIACDSLDSVVLIENGVVGNETKQTARQMAVLDAYLSGYCDKLRENLSSLASHTQGIVTYYFCLSPDISQSQHGFFYSRVGKTGFGEREPLDARTLDPADLEHTTWYYTPIERGRPSWVGPYQAQFLEEMWICSYLVPIYKSGSFIGVLGMDIPLDTLVEQIRSIKVYKTGFASLLNEEGKVFYHPEFEIGSVPVLTGISFSDELFQREKSGDEKIIYSSKGQERQMSFSTLSNGLKLFVSAPTAEIHDSWIRLTRIIVPVTVLIMIVVALVMMLVMRAITRPLQSLTAASKRLAAADYDVKLDYKGKDEVGELTGSFVSMRDKMKLYIEDLNRRIRTDALTGYPNMRYFFELAQAERQRIKENGQYPVFLYFNLIGIKYYNRQFGFDKGDELICEFGRILAAHYGEDHMSRLNQDHFAVVAVDENTEEEIRRVFNECESAFGGKSLPVRAGIYRDRQEGIIVSIAVDRAKYACDQHRGTFVSDFYYFDDYLYKKIENVRYIINNFDMALEKQWIQAYYQPIIRSSTGETCDEETLARWIDPVRGMIAPDGFIPILENARLIYKLDLYILDRILEKLQIQQRDHLKLIPQSLNLSRADFDSCDIVEEICRRIDASGISRELITIEITESMVGSDFDFMKEQIERFRSLGFKVWMDDFGSGYSALDVLQDIRFDVIKFDMRFMKRFDEEEESRVILSKLLQMAGELGIETVCEGVETKEQVEFLKAAGCTRLQGYYFSRPVPFKKQDTV